MRTHYLCRAASIALAAASISPIQAHAEEADTAASDEDIVVTARKREERLQDVPVSVTAFSAITLEKQGFHDFEDLATANPNVKIAQAAGNGVSFNVSIRGNIQNSGTLVVDPSVGTYVDGHLQAHQFGTVGLTVDLSSVQTLKGPQGTLFGRNTTGGAILFTTNDPKLDVLSGYVQGELGGIKTQRFGGAINIPVGSIAALRLVYQNNSRGDYQTFSNGVSQGRKHDYVLRGKLLVEPSPGTRIILTAEKSDERLNSTMDQPTHPNAPRYDLVPVITYASPDPRAPGQAPIDPRAFAELQQATGEFYGLRVEQDVGKGNIKLIAGRRNYDLTIRQTLPPSLGWTQQDKPGNQDTSVELQYNGSLLNDKLDVAAGLFYFDESVHERQNTFLYSGTQRTSRVLDATSKSKSAYLQATAHVSPQFNITGGLRYTDDKKTGSLHASTVGTDGTGTQASALSRPAATNVLSQSKLNYLISVDFTPVDDVMFYVNHSTGYRSGGSGVDRVSSVAANVNYTKLASFLPENVKNYEAGFKTQFLDRMITLNGAFFYQDYQQYQYTAIDPVTVQRVTLNADAKIKGFEGDLTFRLPTNTTLTAYAGHIDARLASGPSSGSNMIQIPRWTWGVGISQKFDVGGGELDFVGNYSWRAKYFTTTNDPLAAGNEEAVSQIDSLGLLNVSATYTNGPVTVAVYADNLTNKGYYTYLTTAGTAINFGALGTRRVIGVRTKYAF